MALIKVPGNVVIARAMEVHPDLDDGTPLMHAMGRKDFHGGSLEITRYLPGEKAEEFFSVLHFCRAREPLNYGSSHHLFSASDNWYLRYVPEETDDSSWPRTPTPLKDLPVTLMVTCDPPAQSDEFPCIPPPVSAV